MTTNTAAIVYVHGISEHQPGYSDAWHEALQPHLAQQVSKEEVRWSDLVNAAGMTYGGDAETIAKVSEEQRLREEINRELKARKLRNRQAAAVVAPSNAPNVYGGSGLPLDDFVRYMVWEETRNQILVRFDDVVLPLLREGRTLHIIAHSWGTVVSYEGLRRLDGSGLPGRVANLIVLGSALSIGAVQSNLFSRVGSGSRPTLVDRFVNVDAGGDVVGGPINPPFDDVTEFLQQVPTGCSMFRFRRLFGQPTARNPLCAHSSYFNHDNVSVQRDIIAKCINPSLA